MFHDVPDIPLPCSRSGGGCQPLCLRAGNVSQLERCSWWQDPKAPWLGREGHGGDRTSPGQEDSGTEEAARKGTVG